MNLVEDVWIPVVFLDGNPGQVSLSEIFSKGTEIVDLAMRPHERIALMRLLVCVGQAALDGPVDHADWLGCKERIADAALEYLARWKHAFELLGDGQRFLQVPNLRQLGGSVPNTPITKLDVAMATGNNATLFDNGGGSERVFETSRSALSILTFQCFSPGGTIGEALWSDNLTKSKSDHAPCISRSMLHTYIRGGNLESTVRLNLLHKEQVQQLIQWGRPVWESWPESLNAKQSIVNATETYLGRLVPISRAIRLWPDSERIINAVAQRTTIADIGLRSNEEMTYLTQLVVHTRLAQRQRLTDSYAWHRAVWACFPAQPERKRDYLTRLDRVRDQFRLLIASPDIPVRPARAVDWRSREIPPDYFDAKRYRFQLCANPTKKIAARQDGSLSKNGRRVPLTSREDLVKWMERKAEQGGFTIESQSLHIVPRGREYFSRKGQLGLHNAVDFQGTLRVLNDNRFYETFQRGIGSAKAFGFGLLMPVPIRMTHENKERTESSEVD